jgi:signal peptidase I
LGVITAVLVYAGIRHRLRRYEIVERSMQPTLQPGDYVVGIPTGEIARADIVVFTHPAIEGFELVKRVVGLPGESVAIHNGQVNIEGRVLAEGWADGPTLPDGEWQLGPDQVFVLGDNRALSTSDSRTLGPIPVDSIGWRIVARYWPLHAVGRLSGA